MLTRAENFTCSRRAVERVTCDNEKIAVIIPTLNEEKGIGLILDRVKMAMEHYNYEILVVDGHSADGTLRIAKEKGVSILFQPGIGYGDALRAGFRHACQSMGAEIIVMADADGTYDPYDVPALANPILMDEADVVIGNRFGRMDDGAMTSINFIGNKILSLAARLLLELKVSDTQCGLRAMRASLLWKVEFKSDGMSFATEMLARFRKIGARISEVPVSYHVRRGNSKMRRFRDGFEILRMILVEVE